MRGKGRVERDHLYRKSKYPLETFLNLSREDDKGTVQPLPFTSEPPTQAPHGSMGLWNLRGTWLVLGWWQGAAPRRGGQLVLLGTLAQLPTDQPDVSMGPRGQA